jgi:hypothetical protein
VLSGQPQFSVVFRIVCVFRFFYDDLVKAFGWALSFYSAGVAIVCLVSLVVFTDSFSLFKRLVLVSDKSTASPLGVRE